MNADREKEQSNLAVKKRFATKTNNDNIFHNGVDAALGILALLLIPLVSLIGVFITYGEDFVGDAVLSNAFLGYTFPVGAICVAGIYDSYGRVTEVRTAAGVKKGRWNKKLVVRVVLDGAALVLALVCLLVPVSLLRYFPPAILLAAGTFVVGEATSRIFWRFTSSPLVSKYVYINFSRLMKNAIHKIKAKIKK